MPLTAPTSDTASATIGSIRYNRADSSTDIGKRGASAVADAAATAAASRATTAA